jgi:cob(I)alamin adenosyltransferase
MENSKPAMEKKVKNRIILLTGQGKGKTSSALGMVLRAVGHQMRVCVIQFVKKSRETGEARALALLPGVEHLICGNGFVTHQENPERLDQHCQAATEGLRIAKSRMADPAVHMIVLDEICAALHHHLLEEQEVVDLLTSAGTEKIIILTGRHAPKALVDCADTVSLIDNAKHGYDQGIEAQPGVEF